MWIFKFVLYAFAVLGICLFPFLPSFLISFISHFKEGDKLPVRQFPSTWTNVNLFYKIFVQFPKQVVQDLFDRDPDAFPMSLTGLVIFEGKQGTGKTAGAVYYMDMLKSKYPRLSIMSNISFTLADTRLDDWTDIVFKSNGIYGQVVFIDEIQNYFNSLESKNFPPEMLGEVCQQRKQRKTIIGTTQVFGRVAKPIREQVNMLVRPRTIFGCFTILSCFEPSMDSDGQVEKLRRLHTYCFVHTKRYRDAYDTYETVERHAIHGFKDKMPSDAI